jgi:DNA helicase IV
MKYCPRNVRGLLRGRFCACFGGVRPGMSVATPPSDPEIAAEQAALDHALSSLAAMRQRAEGLLRDLIAAGNPDLDYVAALSRRVSLLAESPRPLFFGRIDEEDGPTWHIGRRHVEDTRSDPVVIDWRAPVAVPFYRASAKDALGLARRRQIMVDRRAIVAVADDLFGVAGDENSGTRLRGGDALLAELERARTGEMLDIVATIQAEQDEIIRAPLDELLTVQGGPGTGKTAVGLHRAAFLLYNHPELSREGVLVLGPSRAFLRYIAQVLPALGEEAVVQTTIGDIAPKARVRVVEPMEVRKIKADARMGEVLRRALHGRRRPLEEDVSLRVRFARATLSRERINDLVSSILARPGPYKSGRLALRARLVSEARSAFRSSGRLGADEAWFEGELTSSDEFRALLDSLWPTVSPTTLVRDLLSSRGQLERAASGVLSPDEWPLLLRNRGTTVSSTAWSFDDLALLDETAFLIGGRSRSYGHIVVDEAQDLTPMQFRMIARRSPSGSITVLGDLAQATGPWTYENWDEIRMHLPDAGVPHHDELTLGYRAPGRVLDFASRLLPSAAPGVTPTSSIRAGRSDPAVRRVPENELASASLEEAAALARDHALVAIVVPEDLVPEVTRLARRNTQVGVLERDAMTRPMTIVPAPAAKGLEFDAVVVVEPAAIAGDDRRGLRLLYVAMTRPIQHLSVVHAQPLPASLLG